MNVESNLTETHAKECKIDFALKAFSLFSWTQLDFWGVERKRRGWQDGKKSRTDGMYEFMQRGEMNRSE